MLSCLTQRPPGSPKTGVPVRKLRICGAHEKSGVSSGPPPFLTSPENKRNGNFSRQRKQGAWALWLWLSYFLKKKKKNTHKKNCFQKGLNLQTEFR